MGNNTIEKVYDLKALGGKVVYGDLDNINKMFVEIKKNKQALDAVRTSTTESDRLKEVNRQLDALRVKEKEMLIQAKEIHLYKINSAREATEAARKEAVEGESAAKQMAAAQISTSKAVTEQLTADARKQTEVTKQATEARKQGLLSEREAAAKLQTQLKELQLQRAQERAGRTKDTPLPGSYNAVNNQYKDLLSISRNTTNLSNPAELQAASAELMKFKAQLDAFNRGLTQDGVLIGEYTSGIVNAFHKLGLGSYLKEQVNEAKASLETLNTEFERLMAELREIKATGAGNLGAIERQLIENRQAAIQLEGGIKQVSDSLQAMSGVGSQILHGIGEEFKNMKQQFMSFVIGYLGFQQVISGIQESIHLNYELSDSFANMKTYIKGTDEEVQHLVDSLKHIDTRTSVTGLVDIASIISKKGVAKEEIAGVTQAVDSLMIVLGKEVGDAHETVSSLVKLVNVYSEDKHVTADNINAIGGAIAKLTQSGVATGGFLIDFAERMAGVRGITGLTIDKVLGIGAAMEELGQKTETSATAMSQLVIKLFTDTQRYADITGMSLNDFQQLLHKDVIGALVKVADKLRGNAGEMEHFFEGVEDMHMKGARVVGVLGDIAANADYARKRMADATRAIQTQGIIADSAALKQHNFAASIDRIKKSFELAFISTGFQLTLSAIASVILLITNNLGLLISGLGIYTAIWTVANAQMIIAKVGIWATNVALLAQRAALTVSTLWTKAYSAALLLMVDAEYSATAATVVLWEVISANPIGILIGLIGLAVAAYTAFDSSVRGTTVALKEKAQAMSIEAEISEKANGMIAEQISKLNILKRVVESASSSIDTKRKALDELIKQYPQFKDVLIDETGKVLGLAAAYGKVAAAIKQSAEVKASAELSAEKQKAVLQVTSLRQRAETETTIQTNDTEKSYSRINLNNLSDDDKAIMARVMGKIDPSLNLRQNGSGGYGFDARAIGAISKALQAEQDARAKIAEQYESAAAAKKGISLSGGGIDEDTVNQQGGGGDGRTIDAIRKDIKETKYKLGKAVEDSEDAIALKKHLNELLAELNKATGKEHGGHGTKLTVGEYEGIKTIDADRDNELAKLRTAYAEKDQAQKYYNRIFIDNERVFQQQMQQVEEDALRKKVELITGNKPAEQRARADYHLQLLESQKSYSDKFYHMDLNDLNSKHEDANTGAKDKYDTAENGNGSELDKANAKLQYYQTLQGQYIDFMASMDALEQKYNQQSGKNAAERKRVLEGIENNIGKSLTEIQKEAVDNEFSELDREYNAKMRAILLNKINVTKSIIANPDINDATKKEHMEDAGRGSDKEGVGAKDDYIGKQLELTEYLHNAKIISEKEYNERIDQLRNENLENAQKSFELEVESHAHAQKLKEEALQGSIEVAKTIGDGLLQMSAKQDQVKEDKARREMEWNKKVLNAEVQSNQQRMVNERTMKVQEDQLAHQKAQAEKKRAIAAMAIDYASAAFKIIAANIFKGPEGWAEAAVEEGILAASYAAKIGLASATQAFADGGDVPSSGGTFGGNSHASGGTPFSFRGRSFEAEAGEVAIINKRSANSNAVFNVTGTSKQIASAINAAGGGRNFMPGAAMRRFDYGGTLGMNLQPPSFVSDYYTRGAASGAAADEKLNKVVDMVVSHAHAIQGLADHVSNQRVILDPHHVTDFQNSHAKSVKVGVL